MKTKMKMKMKMIIPFFFYFTLVVRGNTAAGVQEASSSHGVDDELHYLNNQKVYTKLFVFGDSYADTGNNRKSLAGSWKPPYGITFPGKPTGRFSDGRVLTDYIAKHLGLKSPVPYRWMKYAGRNTIRHGINFAYGGSGVFDTVVPNPNMTTQIDFFQKLLLQHHHHSSLFNQTDLRSSSLVLVTLSGNDYGAYLARGGTAQGLPNFISSVVNQLAMNLKRLGEIGARKIAVASLEPLGCLPQSTVLYSYQQCNATENTAVDLHNLLLQQAVDKLNNETKSKDSSAFVILDLYSSFTTLLQTKGDHSAGGLQFESPLKPCCVGVTGNYSCGDVNEIGEKMYRVCSDPTSAFFWDTVHPTQAGWHAVYDAMQPLLHRIFSL